MIKGVYIIKIIDQPFYKIGYAKDIMQRFHNLTCASPFNLEIISVYQHNNPYQLEASLHHLFKNKRVRGEWFRLKDKDITHLDHIEFERIHLKNRELVSINTLSIKRRVHKTRYIKMIDGRAWLVFISNQIINNKIVELKENIVPFKEIFDFGKRKGFISNNIEWLGEKAYCSDEPCW